MASSAAALNAAPAIRAPFSPDQGPGDLRACAEPACRAAAAAAWSRSSRRISLYLMDAILLRLDAGRRLLVEPSWRGCGLSLALYFGGGESERGPRCRAEGAMEVVGVILDEPG